MLMQLCRKLFFSGRNNMLDVVPLIQTIHSVNTAKPVGGEILCRVRTPSGLVLTNEYIEYIEKSDHADKYTVKLLTSLLDFYSGRDASHLNNFVFSLNVRMFQINSLSLRKSIEQFIECFPAKIKVQLEIVERGIPELTEEMVESIGLYHSKGVKVVMDDFIFDKKTIKYFGVSQLSSIKLDREITMVYHDCLVHLTLLEALVGFAKKFGLAVVAEGIESEIQAELIKRLGVDYLQGYLFSKPMSLSEFDCLMNKF